MKGTYILSQFLFLSQVMSFMQTVYNSNYTVAYIKSSNGSLYQLNIKRGSNTAADILSDLKEVSTPPANSSLVVDSNDVLHAIWGTSCGSGPIEVSVFNSSKNQWISEAQSNMNTESWFNDDQVIWIDRSQDNIYIYGGQCNGKVSNEFYSYNLENKEFSIANPSSGIMPRAMASAQSVILDDYRVLLLGGHNDNAWMSMQQLAIYGYNSWSFVPVGNSSNIDSRDDPLLLPIWENSDEAVTEIVVIGGTVAGRDSNPQLAMLNYTDQQGWQFSSPNDVSAIDLSYAAVVIYDTLVSISVDSQSQGQGGSNIDVQLYGRSSSNQWDSVSQVHVPSSDSSKHEGKSTSTAVIAVVSTLLPLIAIGLVIISGWWFWRKRRERRLFLLPNKRSMMREAPPDNSSDWNYGSSFYRIPSTRSQASYETQGTTPAADMILPKQRQSLRVVNPDVFATDSEVDSVLEKSYGNLHNQNSAQDNVGVPNNNYSQLTNKQTNQVDLQSQPSQLSSLYSPHPSDWTSTSLVISDSDSGSNSGSSRNSSWSTVNNDSQFRHRTAHSTDFDFDMH